MPPPDQTTNQTPAPDNRTPHAEANVNVTTPPAPDQTGVFAGMGVWTKTVVAGGATALVLFLFYSAFNFGMVQIKELLAQQRADAIEHRLLFRESIKQLQDNDDRRYRDRNDEENRRAGELKGAIDKNTEVVRQWIEESRTARAARGVSARPPESLPKPINP